MVERKIQLAIKWPNIMILCQVSVLNVISFNAFIGEVTCEYWQALGFIVCIGMYGGLYCETFWYVLAWYVLWHVLVCIIFVTYYMYW